MELVILEQKMRDMVSPEAYLPFATAFENARLQLSMIDKIFYDHLHPGGKHETILSLYP
jgi:hypothetical protein